MPTYEYLCEANGRVLEVRHKMAEKLTTWGELCVQAGISPGRTDPHAPVSKLMSAGFIGTGSAGASAPGAELGCGAPECGLNECGSGFCGSGMCGLGED